MESHGTRAGSPARPARSRLAGLLAMVAAGSLAACSSGGGAAAPSTASPSATSSNPCPSTATVHVSVAPALQRIVEEQARYVATAACADYQVSGDPPTAVMARGSERAQLPDLWIPDSPLWPSQVNALAPNTYRVSEDAIATSPITLAVPDSLSASGKVPTGQVPMAQMLTGAGPSLAIATPGSSTESMLIMMAAWGNAKTPAAQVSAGRSFLTVASARSTDEQLYNRAIPGAKEGPAVFPASEQGMAQFNNQHSDAHLTALGATEGLAGLKYVAAIPTGADPATAAAAQALAARLRSPLAVNAIKAAGFRVNGQGTVSVPGLPQEVPIALDAPSPEQYRSITALMGRLARPVKMLLVVDTSGSMAQPSGFGGTRLELVMRSVATALNFIPPRTQGGLWQFSSADQLGGTGYRELVPMSLLADPEGNVLPAALNLSSTFDAMAKNVGGGTALYNTIWSAYQSAQATADATTTSVVALLTDGRNEDADGSLTLDQLLANIRAAQAANPAKPVKLVLGGIGPDADLDTLRAIASATGGSAPALDNRTSLIDVLVGAVL